MYREYVYEVYIYGNFIIIVFKERFVGLNIVLRFY